MDLINNTTKTLKDDLSVEIKQGSKISIAAACFSIYAFQELKTQLSQIDELRFIFTSPTFVTEKAKKVLENVYNEEDIKQGYFAEGLVSRKKQILPAILENLD